jgi:hypothetical protein
LVSELPDDMLLEDQKILAMKILKRVDPTIFPDTIWNAAENYNRAVDVMFTEKFPLGKKIQVCSLTLTLTLKLTILNSRYAIILNIPATMTIVGHYEIPPPLSG